MIKIHIYQCDEGPSSLLKISLYQKFKKKNLKKKSLARLSQEKNKMRDKVFLRNLLMVRHKWILKLCFALDGCQTWSRNIKVGPLFESMIFKIPRSSTA